MSANKHKSKRIMTAVLCAVVVVTCSAASIMAGCGCSKEEQVSATAATNTSTEDNTSNTAGSDNSAKTASSANTAETGGNQSNEANENGESNENAGNSGSQNSSASPQSGNTSSAGGSGTVTVSKDSANSNKTHSSKKECTVNGIKYYVGDTVTCVYELKSPEKLVNFQGEISYNSKCLKIKSAVLESPASSGSIINYKNLTGKISFNGSSISMGYDYSKGGKFITVVYEVIGEGTAETGFTWQSARGFDSNTAYVTNGNPAGGLDITMNFS